MSIVRRMVRQGPRSRRSLGIVVEVPEEPESLEPKTTDFAVQNPTGRSVADSPQIRVADRPHSFTLWLSLGALLVSLSSACFSGLQWLESHRERQKPSALQIVEQPRLSIESVGGSEFLVAKDHVGWTGGGPNSENDRVIAVTARVTIRNTGRTGASLIDDGCRYYAWFLNPATGGPSSSTVPRNETHCQVYRGRLTRTITLSPNETAEIRFTSDLAQTERDRFLKGKVIILLAGEILYEDSFRRVLKTNMVGTISGGMTPPVFNIQSVSYSP
jgi:hypothetical protein